MMGGNGFGEADMPNLGNGLDGGGSWDKQSNSGSNGPYPV